MRKFRSRLEITIGDVIPFRWGGRHRAGLGGQLLAAAALRCLRLAGEGGGILLIIDAKSDRVRKVVCQLWCRAPPGIGFDPGDAIGDVAT